MMKYLYTCIALICLSGIACASNKAAAGYSAALSLEPGQMIKAQKIALNVKEGKECSHIAKYENGEIITQIGGLASILGNMSLNLAGEQMVTMYNSAGQVCFTSVSKNWELQNKVVVHHHDGFDVHTAMKKQWVEMH